MNPYNPSSFPCMISIAGKYSNGDKYFKNSYLSLMFAINEIIYTPIAIEIIMVPVRLWLFVSTEANKPASTKSNCKSKINSINKDNRPTKYLSISKEENAAYDTTNMIKVKKIQ